MMRFTVRRDTAVPGPQSPAGSNDMPPLTSDRHKHSSGPKRMLSVYKVNMSSMRLILCCLSQPAQDKNVPYMSFQGIN